MSASLSLPVCQVMVVFPGSGPAGTGFGSARRITPNSCFAGVAAESELAPVSAEVEDSCPQPTRRRLASMRQSAVPHARVKVDSCRGFVDMVALKNGSRYTQLILSSCADRG